jgi:hypothetical protein
MPQATQELNTHKGISVEKKGHRRGKGVPQRPWGAVEAVGVRSRQATVQQLFNSIPLVRNSLSLDGSVISRHIGHAHRNVG